MLWFGLQCVIVVFPDHTHFILIHSFKIQHKSGIGVIVHFLEHGIWVMWNIDHLSLVSRGWPRDDSFTYSSQHRKYSYSAGQISRQILVLYKHILFTLKGEGT